MSAHAHSEPTQSPFLGLPTKASRKAAGAKYRSALGVAAMKSRAEAVVGKSGGRHRPPSKAMMFGGPKRAAKATAALASNAIGSTMRAAAFPLRGAPAQ